MKGLTEEEKNFIQANLSRSPSELMLQAGRYPHLPLTELVQQIQARQKAATKLPTWASSPDTIFPLALSVEQTSSEVTAAYKASLVSGELLIDLTGGFGVDSFYFAKHFKRIIHVEQQEALSAKAAFNFSLLKADNIETHPTSAEDFLGSFQGMADVIFLDPARRGSSKEKLHLLQDCEPDVLHLLPLLFTKTRSVLLKTSPMLDIDLAIEQLGYVAKVWVLAVQNECKEVLYLLTPNKSDQIERTAVNLTAHGSAHPISFTKEMEEAATPVYMEPQAFIYEPNAAILKAGAYRFLGEHFGLSKLHPNSHLYTCETLLPDFPGRSFRCLAVSRYNKKELLARIPGKKANITVRNFPESVASIRQKTGLKEGGAVYLFFTTDKSQKPVVLICEKA